MKFYLFYIPIFIYLITTVAVAQTQEQSSNGTEIVKKTPTNTILIDTTKKKKHNHRTATKRSALIPGWGQAYNKEYWKIPIVYGALAIPTITFFYNNTWYNRTREAYDLKFKASATGATIQDTNNLQKIHPDLQRASLGTLQTFRSAFRQDRDYSVLWFVIVWGLNVVDATVFGHLKEFDVSDDISMQVNPSINPINNSKGLSLCFSLKKPNKKLLALP